MEIVDNALMLLIPGAMDAPLAIARGSGGVSPSSLFVARGIAAFPVNRWLIARGRGHAVVHAHHGPGHQRVGKRKYFSRRGNPYGAGTAST